MVFETTTSERGAPTDSAPMTFKKLMNDLERQGVLDLTVAGHKLSRPSGVLRGDEPDRHSSVLNLFSGSVYNMHDTSMQWHSRFIMDMAGMTSSTSLFPSFVQTPPK